MKRLSTFILLASIGLRANGQERSPYVWESGIQVAYNMWDNWSFATSVGQRTIWLEDEVKTQARLNFLEIDQFATYRITPQLKGSFGYKFRSNEPVADVSILENRLTQQLAYIHFNRSVRLISRARTEQRIRNDSFASRYRYRISADLPLNGEKMDSKEFYAVVTNEFLYETVNVEPNTWENRTSISLGYLVNRGLKVETSLTYRMEDFTRDIIPFLFINTGVFIKLE